MSLRGCIGHGTALAAELERVLLLAADQRRTCHGGATSWASGSTRRRIPGYLAIVDPDGTEHARRRRAGPGQPGRARAARARACSRATRSRRCCPTARNPMHVYLAALQAGLVLRADQLPPVARPRSRTSSQDTDAKAFVSHERFADARRARPPTRPASRRERALAHGTVPGLPLVRRARRPRSRPTLPDDRVDRRGDALHVGHDRQAQGREARRSPTSTPT